MSSTTSNWIWTCRLGLNFTSVSLTTSSSWIATCRLGLKFTSLSLTATSNWIPACRLCYSQQLDSNSIIWGFTSVSLTTIPAVELLLNFTSVSVTTSSRMPASVAQLDAPSDWRPGGRGFSPRRGRQHSFVEIDHEIFSTVILSLPLIQEGQLSVSGERMCTVLVNRLED